MSGMRPTGRLHLGNWAGALSNWIRLQDEYACFFAVADWHALTTGYEATASLRGDISDMVVDWLACGLDPQKCVLFVQSDVPEHAELALLLSMITPVPWLERVPTYKAQLEALQDKDIQTHGFLGYPVLQAADIIVYKAQAVPVGEDQLPHLELTREIVRRFNHLYRPVFPEPQALLTPQAALLGTDGRKMSKSYQNTIGITEDPKMVEQKVLSMVTDPQRIHLSDPGRPEVCPVFSMHRLWSPDADRVAADCRAAAIGCVADKKHLAASLIRFTEPFVERRHEILKHPDDVRDILRDGAEKARAVARQTLAEVREAMGLWPLTSLS